MWVAPDVNNCYRAKCKLCNCTMKADITNIKRDTQTAADTKVKEAEIKLSAVFAARNLPLTLMDHLDSVLKECFPDSKIAQGIQMKCNKVTAVTLVGVKTACIVVHYFSEEEHKVVSRFWDLVQVYDPCDSASVEKGGTAENFYAKIVESFEKANVPLSNVIDFASDCCNTMMIENNSVASHFRESCPGIIIMICICHSLHLCSSAGCKEIKRCDDMARNIHSFFFLNNISNVFEYGCLKNAAPILNPLTVTVSCDGKNFGELGTTLPSLIGRWF
ncbi:hypothetical protein PR048_004856 [Dryococelus australis]|uniref:DUF659 domain-containing protein n=1 Tax=Dryococelus australis TaxID=614101 RepID=A0ABQ9I6J7_9NEOP|nr:hypothetical protein PR048_004856 [Dryococelus australis]